MNLCKSAPLRRIDLIFWKEKLKEVRERERIKDDSSEIDPLISFNNRLVTATASDLSR